MNTVRIKSVEAPPGGRFALKIEWDDGTKANVNLTGLIHSSKNFGRFLEQPRAFREVKVVHFGTGIAWANGLDYGAETLKVLADEQKPIGGKFLRSFETRNGLNTSETAALLDVAERTVRSYRNADVLPESMAIALRRLDSDPTVFAAHFRPVEKRERGRPRKRA